MDRTGAGVGDLVPARGGICAGEMAAPGAAFAGQPGRRAGHRHPAADPGHRSWSPCSAVISATMAPRRTAGCSAAPAAACSANRSTAAPGTPPAWPPSAPAWPPRRWPATRMTCGTPPCPCGSTPPASPPRSPPGPGNSARVLYEVYLHCTDGQQDTVSQRIEDALDAGTRGSRPPPDGETSGYANRRHHPGPCPLYVRRSPRRPARSPRIPPAADQGRGRRPQRESTVSPAQTEPEALPAGSGPRIAHGTQPTVRVTAPFHAKR